MQDKDEQQSKQEDLGGLGESQEQQNEEQAETNVLYNTLQYCIIYCSNDKYSGEEHIELVSKDCQTIPSTFSLLPWLPAARNIKPNLSKLYRCAWHSFFVWDVFACWVDSCWRES